MTDKEYYGREGAHPEDGQEVPMGDNPLVSTAEINQQIATAKRYPRSLTRFRREAMEMVSLNVGVAEQCTYILPARGGSKPIEGPSARFAEIILACWGNIRSSAEVVDEGDEYVEAEGICYDLERNNAIKFRVRRRIVDRDGKRYNADMRAMTGNAAASIALRNAVLKVVPKAFWSDIHDKAKHTAASGGDETLESRRVRVLKAFKDMGVQPSQIYELLGIAGLEDLTTDHIATLGGIMTAIRDGDTTIEATFGASDKPRNAVVRTNGKTNEFVRDPNAKEVPPENIKPARRQEEEKQEPKPAKPVPQQAKAEEPKPSPMQEEAPSTGEIEPEREPGDDYAEDRDAEPPRIDYEDWYRSQCAKLAACKYIRDVGPLREEVRNNLDTPGREEDWDAKCDARRDEILSATAAPKGGKKK